MVKVVDRDRGYVGMRQRLRLLKGSYTKVGIQAGSRETDGVTDLVTVAASNEFGTTRIPERSFLRSTFEEERGRLAEITAAEADAVLAGTKDIDVSLSLIGLYFTGRVQAKIHSHPPPPNDPKTIERKGSSGTLVDSGQMVQSIRYVNYIPGRAS
jgi:hypothetical protein